MARHRIADVDVVAFDVYRPDASGFIPSLFNALHFTTRTSVVRREVLLLPGETYDSARAAETERVLRSMGIFRSVRIDTVRTEQGLRLRVETQDAFSTRLEGAISGSLNSNSWWIALNESNLLGTATQLGVRYRNTPDRDAITTAFSRNRLVGNRIGVAAMYDNRSDGWAAYGIVGVPFFSFASRSSWTLSGDRRDERVLRFREGSPVPSDTLQRQMSTGRATVGWMLWGNSAGYLRLGVSGQVRREDYRPFADSGAFPKSITGAVGGWVEWRKARFKVSTDVEGFGREEDVDLSLVSRFGLYLTPKAFGYDDDGVAPSATVRAGYEWNSNFLTGVASIGGRIGRSWDVDSGSAHLGAMMVLKPRSAQTAIFFAGRGWQRNPSPGQEFDMGLGFGPRGFEQHYFTGDRAFLLATEYRYRVTDRFLQSAGLGLAAFAEYGGAWYARSATRTGYSFGIGVRAGLTVATDVSPGRLDLAYFKGDGMVRGNWRIVVGKGYVFRTNGRLDEVP